MERCFIIESSAKLHKKYFDYIALRDKNNGIIKKFVSENITDERKNFTYSTNYDHSFSIVLTDEEYEKFKPQLLKNYTFTGDGKLYTFKKRSPIGKLYAQLNIEPAGKPSIQWNLNFPLMRARTRLFDYEGVLYSTIDSGEIADKTKFPEGWREISKSEFYAVIDKIEQEEK